MIKIFPNIEELSFFAAEKFIEIGNNSIEQHGIFSVALAGGSTPKSLYRLLSGEKFKNRLNWSRVYFFFGDERHVPPDDPQSNFRMANENFFQTLKVSENNIFRWKTEEKNAKAAADDYEFRILNFFDKKRLSNEESDDKPSFDLILLGMGADGHTASLFPFSEALKKLDKIAVETVIEKLNTTRLTLTFSVINNARNVIFLVAGEEKAETLRACLEGKFEPERLPAQNVRPKDGNLFWLIDKNVAKLLENDGI